MPRIHTYNYVYHTYTIPCFDRSKCETYGSLDDLCVCLLHAGVVRQRECIIQNLIAWLFRFGSRDGSKRCRYIYIYMRSKLMLEISDSNGSS